MFARGIKCDTFRAAQGDRWRSLRGVCHPHDPSFRSAGFLAGVYLTVIKIMGEAIGRRPLLTLSILLMVVGVQFVSFGLLGEMVANLRSEELSYPIRERLSREDDAGDSC